MNKAKIKAELRRIACNEQYPMFADLSTETCDVAEYYLPDNNEFDWDDDLENKRIFFLLVAEAL